MKNTKTFDELVQIVDQNLKAIEKQEANSKTRKEKIKNFWKMLIEWISNINFGWVWYTNIEYNTKKLLLDPSLWEYAEWLSPIQIDAVKLARDIQYALNSTKWIFTENEAAQMIQTKDNMYNMYKKQFERNTA